MTIRRAAAWTAVALAALLVVAYAARNAVARKALEVAVERQTGFPLRVGALDIGLFRGTLDVRDLHLGNPPEFPDPRFVSVPRVHVDYETRSFLRGAPHLRELSVRVDEVVLVTNEHGEKNSARLTANLGGGTKERRRYRVDVLRVHVGTVRVEDHTRGRPTQRTIALNLDRTYRNVTDSTNVSNLVLGTVLQQAGGAVGEVGKGVGKGVGDALRKLGVGKQETRPRRGGPSHQHRP